MSQSLAFGRPCLDPDSAGGAALFWAAAGPANANHQCGTLRMGVDTSTSVVRADGRVHELDNLYVVDSSFFVSSAAVNPTLTIVANAMRVGDRLKERLG